MINGISDHEAQYLCVNNILDQQTGNFRLVKKRLITKPAVSAFIEKLKSEFWDYIINHMYVNTKFNLFLNTFLILIFLILFLIQQITTKQNEHQQNLQITMQNMQ